MNDGDETNTEFKANVELNEGEPQARLDPENVGNLIMEGKVNEALFKLAFGVLHLKEDPKFKEFIDKKDYESIYTRILSGFIINAEALFPIVRNNRRDLDALFNLLENIQGATDEVYKEFPLDKFEETYKNTPYADEFDTKVAKLKANVSTMILEIDAKADEARRKAEAEAAEAKRIKDSKALGESYT